jgi:molybdenum cofactor cytidylyltransferase
VKFGPVPLAEAKGAVLAHRVRTGTRTLSKGHVLTDADIEILKASGIFSVIVARIEASDVAEDKAASRAAAAAAGTGLTVAKAFTGRANVFASADGLFVPERAIVDALNRIDEAITIATVPAFSPVKAGDMVATIKVIPFAAPADALQRWERICQEQGIALSLKSFRALSAALIETRLPDTKASVLEKTVVTTRNRIEAINGTLDWHTVVPHNEAAVARAIGEAKERKVDLVFIMGASAIQDRHDIIPSAIAAAGGAIEHFGMPVDPGNLLLLASHPAIGPIFGLPGCARSPKVNGFDWVLERTAAGIPVTGTDIMGMGVGGLLAEIPVRGLPRTATPASANGKPRIAAVILAAGQSRRMGERNKLAIPVLAGDGTKPMIAHAVDTAISSGARPIVVVLGHEDDKVRAILAGREVTFVVNPDYASGISTSLRTGIKALPSGLDGALILLGDMPRVDAADVKKLIAAFNPTEGRAIAVPTHRGKRGNPVLFGSSFFTAMMGAAGDTGAKHLIGRNEDQVIEVEMESDAVLTDIDDPAALASLQAGTVANP